MDLDSRAQYKLVSVGYNDVNFEEYRRILEVLFPLGERYDHETSEMWYSRIRDPFRKILEKNPRILSKNGFITMYGKLYESDSKVHDHPSNYIYCSVCDSLVFIPGEYIRHFYRNQDNHLKRCISRNTILNEHARRKEILQLIDTREFQIWQYKQYILKEEVEMKRLQLELLSQSIPHLEKDKLASVLYDHDACLTDYKIYAQPTAIISKNTMPACNSNAGQKMVLPISHHVLNQRSKALNGPTPPPLPRKPDALMRRSASAPEISSRTSLNDLAEAYFNSVRKNAGRK